MTMRTSVRTWRLGTKRLPDSIAKRGRIRKIDLPDVAAHVLDRQHASTGEIIHFAIGERPDVIGAKALFLWPVPTSDGTLDFIYDRRPRNLRHSGHAAGDIAGSVTVASGSAALTGTSTAFTASMDGAILRFGTTSVRPDWEYGDNPYVEQRAIRSVNAADGAGDGRSGCGVRRAHTKLLLASGVES